MPNSSQVENNAKIVFEGLCLVKASLTDMKMEKLWRCDP